MSEHLVASCRVCKNVYDVDYNPPEYCHDDDSWDIHVIQADSWREAVEKVIQIISNKPSNT